MTRRLATLFLLSLELGAPLRGAVATPVDHEVEVRERLTSLQADHDAERRLAQRWLSVHLRREDYPVLADALPSVGEEGCVRLAQALAEQDRHLGLALLLSTDSDADLARVGRAALFEMIARWSVSAADPPQPRAWLPDFWREEADEPLRTDPATGVLGEVIDRLGRLGGLPAPLVLDPTLDPGVRRYVPDPLHGAGPLEGTWIELLVGIVNTHRVTFEVLGHRSRSEMEPLRPWIHVCKRGDDGERSASELLVGWCETVATDPDPRLRAACARALTASGWPAAILWLADRVADQGDTAALEGVLAAAARGLVAPLLAQPERLRALLSSADRKLAGAEPDARGFAERVARAVATVGPTGASGEPLDAILLDGWDDLPAGSRWIRLVAFEGHGASAAAAAAAGEVVSDPASSAALRFQALRALAQTSPRDAAAVPRLGGPEALLAHARAQRRLEELGHLLVATGVRLPEGSWTDGLPLDPDIQLTLLEWAARSGDHARALDALERVLRSPRGVEPLVGRVRVWCGLGARSAVVGLLEQAAASSERLVSAGARRVALRSGVPVPGAAAAVERLFDAGALPVDEWRDLGALAADPEYGERAQAALVGALERGEPFELVEPGVAEALAGLRRLRRDDEARALRGRLRRAAGDRLREGDLGILGVGALPEPEHPVRLLEDGDRVLGPL